MNIAQHTSTTFTYYAFVSYSHKDEKWGKWIQSALERYRLPAAVRKEVGKPLPQRIHPVFRDDTDLGPGRLDDNLRQELEQSRYLIVVCSPNSANPNAEGKHWVNEEVSRFCELGRADRVIPVIVEGTEKTAFCPKIAEEGLLGLDATKHPKARILNDLVATILGLRPDELWRREERRLRARRRWRIFGATLAASLVALGGYIAWDCTRTVKTYYADYVDSFGLPKGIFPLKAKQTTGRDHTYVFYFEGYFPSGNPHGKQDNEPWGVLSHFGYCRRLQKVEQVNGRGWPSKLKHSVEMADRSPMMVFYYDGSRLTETHHFEFNEMGDSLALTKRTIFSTENNDINGIAEFHGKSNASFLRQSSQLSSTDILSSKETARSRIAKHRITRDKHGRPIQILYLNAAGAATSDADGIWGVEQSFDALGRLTECWYLNNHYVRSKNRFGVSGKKLLWTNRTIEKTIFMDASGTPVFNHFGYMICEDTYDDKDRVVTNRFYDANLKSVINLGDCVAGFVSRYDDYGNRTEFASIDQNGSLLIGKGSGFAGWASEFDEYGRAIKRIYFDDKKNPVITKSGYAGWTHFYDEAHNSIMTMYIGTNNTPIKCNEGYAGWIDQYDEKGNNTTRTYLGISAEPVLSNDGFSKATMEYDTDGNMTTCSFWGLDDKLTITAEGIAKRRCKYDIAGNLEMVSCIGIDGNPIINNNGFALGKMQYDERGNVTKISFFGTNSEPVLDKDGIAGAICEFDDQGNMTQCQYFGLQGEPVFDHRGIHGWKSDFDNKGNEIQRSYIDGHGALYLLESGYSGWKETYNDNGKVTWCEFFDDHGNPVMRTERVAAWKSEFDSRGNEILREYFDEKGHLTISDEGIAGYKCKFDKFDNEIRRAFFGNDRAPILNYQGVAGYDCEYDNLGNETATHFFDIFNNPVTIAIACKQVVSGGNAAKLGIHSGDIIVRLGDYELFGHNSFSTFETAKNKCYKDKKVVIFARNENNLWRCFPVAFPPGLMGVSLEEKTINNARNLDMAYKKFMESYRD